MSLTRQFMNEFRPLFRLLEEPLGRGAYSPMASPFDHPLLRGGFGSFRPAVDLTEEGNSYIVEADLPGVRKEDVDVRIGDGGQSVTIEGKVVRRGASSAGEAAPDMAGSAPAEGQNTNTSSTDVVQTSSTSNQLSTERVSGSSIFTRTVWLPRPVDAQKVAAKLNDGVLTLKMEKAEDKANVKVNVE